MSENPASPSAFLPHAYPFVMIDRIAEFEEGKRIVCVKNITINEDFFEGHYIDNPVMPWCLVMEAMAQTSGLLLSRECKTAYIAGMNKFNFHGPIFPGDALNITATNRGVIGPVHRFAVKAEVDNKTMVEGEIILAEITEGMEGAGAA
jgi:3-hydroxyacyl-[acyl-carrier-protein] dehydratase